MSMEEKQVQADSSAEHIIRIIGVRFRSGGKLYNFDPGDLPVGMGDRVIVQTENGLACGRVAGGRQQVSEDYLKKPLRKVLRVVSEEDVKVLQENEVLEDKARKFCVERIQARTMQMKLVDVEYLFDRSKVIFYFTAEGRVDFRELVKDLAAQLRTRIEMRQIGVRDEAKMIGGFGACGKELCCKTFVREFEPVSIKMAKQQDLTLNPAKISGVCGRLMCCLSYESANYHCFKKGLPKVGKNVKMLQGQAKVVSHHVLKGSITIQTKEGARIDLFEPDLSRLREGLPLDLGAANKEKTEKPQPKQAPVQEFKMEPSAVRGKQTPKPEPVPAKAKAGGSRAGKESLLSKIRKISGTDAADDETAEKPKRKRRRRRFRRKKPGTSSTGSEKKKD